MDKEMEARRYPESDHVPPWSHSGAGRRRGDEHGVSEESTRGPGGFDTALDTGRHPGEAGISSFQRVLVSAEPCDTTPAIVWRLIIGRFRGLRRSSTTTGVLRRHLMKCWKRAA